MYFHQGTEVKSAISTDGRNFEIEPGVRIQGAMPAIIKLPDGRWRMYYQTFEAGGGVFKSAVSPDGLNWSTEAGVRLAAGGEFDPDNIVHPTVIALPTGGYRMYYDGEIRRTEQDFTWRILSATSSDGLIWTKDPGVRIDIYQEPLRAYRVWSAHAEYSELTGTYQLYFTVETPAENLIDGIYLATSSDGLLFTIEEKPQLTPEKESGQFGEGGQIGSYQDPFVLNLPGGKRMFYWVNGEGIHFADLKEAETPPTKESSDWWKDLLKGKLPPINLPHLPAGWQLYIVPAVLLLSGAAVIIYLLRSRRPR